MHKMLKTTGAELCLSKVRVVKVSSKSKNVCFVHVPKMKNALN